MKRHWVVPCGWIHRPSSLVGFVLVFLAAVFRV